MRAYFTVDIPKEDYRYPEDEMIIEWLKSFGWNLMGRDSTKNKLMKEEQSKAIIGEMLASLPNMSQESPDDVIFIGMLHDYQVYFTVSRVIESQITFRLHQENTIRLQRSVEKIIKKIQSNKLFFKKPLQVSDNEVIVYSQGSMNIEMLGQVIRSPLQETFRKNRKDFLLLIFSFVLILSTMALSIVSSTQNTIKANLSDEVFLIGLTTATVSFLGIIQTYIETFIEIKYDHIIIWKYVM